MRKRVFAMLVMLALIMATVCGTAVTGNAVYTDADGVTHYGWSLICDEMNESCFTFGDDGNVDGVFAAEGDISTQRVNMFAVRDVYFEGDEEYTVQATFTPDPETDLSAERTYGILAWYVDADNYLIYWMQQKNVAPDWSGQFYGRVNGVFKKFAAASKLTEYDYWFSAEYEDMWWDNATVTHPDLFGNRQALLDAVVTLKVVSKIEPVTVDGKEYTVRSFELHQIVNGKDFIADKYYLKDITAESPAARVGLYSEVFSYTVSDFAATGTKDQNRAQAVANAIDALGTIDSAEDIQAVNEARVNFNSLLELSRYLPAGTEAKLETAEAAVGTYVDEQILALDSTSATFKDDVDAVYNLYLSLPENLAAKVTKTAELRAAVEESQKPPVVLSAITAAPAAVSLENGAAEAQLKAALTVTANYSDGTEAAVTDYTVSGIDYSLTTEQTVTVTYVEGEITKTATVKVTIAAPAEDDPPATNPPATNPPDDNGKDQGGCFGSISGLAAVIGLMGAAVVVLRKKK